MKCIKNRKRLLKPIKKKYRDTLILTGILILFFGVGITALVFLRRSSQLDMTSAYSVKEEMYGTHGAEISTQKADSFASSYAVSSGNMSLEGVAISDTTKAGLFDLDHESVMFAQNIHEKSYPASITKIMTAILAFNFGDGFCNYILPTSTALMGIISACNIPYDRWMRFMWKIFILWLIVGTVLLIGAQLIHFGPM